MKCTVLKTTLTPWGQMVKGQSVEAEGGKLAALTKLGIIEETKVEVKKKKNKKTDA